MKEQHKRKARSLFSPRHQRIAGVCLSILLQFFVLVAMIYASGQYFVYFYGVCLVVSLVVSLHVSTRRTKLAYKMAWILPILVFPLVGGLMYLILGGNRRPHHHYLQEETQRVQKKHLTPPLDNTHLMAYGPDTFQMAYYLEHTALCPAYPGTRTTYFPRGEDFRPAFLKDLAQAKDYIFLEYFIIAEGILWSQVLEILAQKAREGVDVRVIYDGVGCAATLPMHYPQKLRELGIRCQPFQPFRPLLSIHQNNRDHRKLCVIDGWVGYCSGLNLADEYVGDLERFGDWKDNALRLEGSAVWSLTVFFLTMWMNDRVGRVDYPRFKARKPKLLPPTSGFVVPYMDTPLDGETVCADLLLMMVTKAKRYCYLTTPYLVIDETLTAALCTAARSGVDVRVMTPGVPDKKVVFSVTQSNYLPLLEAGCRVFEYTPGFLHSKTVVADDLYASVGSCNLDYRSLYLQFENGVWLCGDPSVLAVRDDFLDTQRQCQEILLQDCQSIPLRTRLLHAVYRVFSPLF